ncbi:hypothetical protein A2738_01550 [Candidatus Nomurabacteria bacterium RIFCSPHIGHO2_01_FULL_42_15]|uniref:Uncharacterized protein n=1 Tax=Candidatus Nomurabacteria bacterium RIFCSPHIGHO2_01_FULL_42_15 TaxID=1801742 RepID=A0A1F6VG44_9BACT|nr:MAG: hypothetical protein A2738_01550 [Candidatus Nomurabacteria bacterium RIFCSPHIGHO2_01_FULL_42_15]OGI93029.1 MAG: hypothetical protein A3A99_00620 [Candidatus Nomurabacteria bacterium RIFCSPLOWO2_01_FULL_41_18]
MTTTSRTVTFPCPSSEGKDVVDHVVNEDTKMHTSSIIFIGDDQLRVMVSGFGYGVVFWHIG